MNKLIITAALAMMMVGAKAQVVKPDSIIDINKYAKSEELPEDGKMPQFRNGTAGLMRWLSFNVKYPKDAKKYKVEGRVIVSFVVEQDGSIDCIEPRQSLVHFVNKKKAFKGTGMSEDEMTNHFGNLFQDEAIRVLNSMPKWEPGVQFGQPVRVRYTVPLTFAEP